MGGGLINPFSNPRRGRSETAALRGLPQRVSLHDLPTPAACQHAKPASSPVQSVRAWPAAVTPPILCVSNTFLVCFQFPIHSWTHDYCRLTAKAGLLRHPLESGSPEVGFGCKPLILQRNTPATDSRRRSSGDVSLLTFQCCVCVFPIHSWTRDYCRLTAKAGLLRQSFGCKPRIQRNTPATNVSHVAHTGCTQKRTLLSSGG